MEIKLKENRKGGKSEVREQERGNRGQRYIQKSYRRKSE